MSVGAPQWRRLTAAAACLALLASCAPRQHVAGIQRQGDDPFNVVTTFHVSHGTTSQWKKTPLPPGAYHYGPLGFGRLIPRAPQQFGLYDNIHPELLRRLAGGPSTAVETVLVTFRDTLRIPRFPAPAPGVALNDPANVPRLQAAALLAQQVQAARGLLIRGDTLGLKPANIGRIMREFWITRSYLVEVPRDSVRAVARIKDVIYVRPDRAHERPPQTTGNGAPEDNPARAREQLGTEVYESSTLQSGKIALLDTGVRATHDLLDATGQFSGLADCVNGGPGCTPSNAASPADACPAGHGTKSAALISGNAAHDPEFRGLTAIPIDSYRVYGPDNTDPVCGLQLVGSAYLDCLQNVLAHFGGVIVSETQAEDDDRSGLALAADAAFDGGSVILGANGNRVTGSSTRVRCPANARRALGIGAYSILSGNQSVDQLKGPTLDLRIKPDIQTPTSVETADNTGDHGYSSFGGTSCATALAGGAAALLRNLMLGSDESIDPGFVYAALIAAGDRSSPLNQTNGAGHIRLPDACVVAKAKLAISHDETCEATIDMSTAPATRVVAAIWWPEVARWEEDIPVDNHSAFSMELVAPGGSPSVSTSEAESVFERVETSYSGAPGVWTLKVKGLNVTDNPQTLYAVLIAYQ
jgi:serine protease AprX